MKARADDLGAALRWSIATGRGLGRLETRRERLRIEGGLGLRGAESWGQRLRIEAGVGGLGLDLARAAAACAPEATDRNSSANPYGGNHHEYHHRLGGIETAERP